MPWADSILKLQSHAGELSSKCTAFLQDVSNLLDKGVAIKNSVQDVLLDPQFSEAEISWESISSLQSLIESIRLHHVSKNSVKSLVHVCE